ncbi:uncharacterized protein BCR38DRAFT_416 [Pseudomassariella vexata]|uniref:Uncharacterized protein n=1 Tax=Pseudomassariella vexata TaxID=1141098 RepID=A0A1Y2EJB3_9PEZI|nr:uncharacterized protein BCR38DRAFT_416 [Pseudomassariella vexata]ORY70895.1 hypothetical protein BCR38DRAFT_416 [Pseudomassariella vexata]
MRMHTLQTLPPNVLFRSGLSESRTGWLFFFYDMHVYTHIKGIKTVLSRLSYLNSSETSEGVSISRLNISALISSVARQMLMIRCTLSPLPTAMWLPIGPHYPCTRTNTPRRPVPTRLRCISLTSSWLSVGALSIADPTPTRCRKSWQMDSNDIIGMGFRPRFL